MQNSTVSQKILDMYNVTPIEKQKIDFYLKCFQKAFDSLNFDEEKHQYYINENVYNAQTKQYEEKKIILPSTTTLLGGYSKHFETYDIAKKRHIDIQGDSVGVSVQDIVNEWALAGIRGSCKGTIIHEKLENFYLTGKLDENIDLKRINQLILSQIYPREKTIKALIDDCYNKYHETKELDLSQIKKMFENIFSPTSTSAGILNVRDEKYKKIEKSFLNNLVKNFTNKIIDEKEVDVQILLSDFFKNNPSSEKRLKEELVDEVFGQLYTKENTGINLKLINSGFSQNLQKTYEKQNIKLNFQDNEEKLKFEESFNKKMLKIVSGIYKEQNVFNFRESNIINLEIDYNLANIIKSGKIEEVHKAAKDLSKKYFCHPTYRKTEEEIKEDIKDLEKNIVEDLRYHLPIMKNAVKTMKENLNDIVPISTELRMFSKKYFMAGTGDLVGFNRKTDEIAILDHKTNKKVIEFFNSFGNKQLGILSKFNDSNGTHYSEQLKIYEYVLLDTLNTMVKNNKELSIEAKNLFGDNYLELFNKNKEKSYSYILHYNVSESLDEKLGKTLYNFFSKKISQINKKINSLKNDKLEVDEIVNPQNQAGKLLSEKEKLMNCLKKEQEKVDYYKQKEAFNQIRKNNSNKNGFILMKIDDEFLNVAEKILEDNRNKYIDKNDMIYLNSKDVIISNSGITSDVLNNNYDRINSFLEKSQIDIEDIKVSNNLISKRSNFEHEL